MSGPFYVYGVRLKGDREVRYVGFTSKPLDERLCCHIKQCIDPNSNRPLLPWVRENRDAVEAFAIAKCDSADEARATESTIIALCLRLNQRLLNTAQVPPLLQHVAA